MAEKKKTSVFIDQDKLYTLSRLKEEGFDTANKIRALDMEDLCEHGLESELRNILELKEAIKAKMENEGHTIIDVGTYSPESVDYPKYGHAVGRAVASGEAERGIAVCGSGIGISIACNKVPGIRAALCTSVEMAEMCRRHNNANVVCMGARMISQELAFDIIDTWMTTEFEGGKHLRRINEIEDLDF